MHIVVVEYDAAMQRGTRWIGKLDERFPWWRWAAAAVLSGGSGLLLWWLSAFFDWWARGFQSDDPATAAELFYESSICWNFALCCGIVYSVSMAMLISRWKKWHGKRR